MTKFERIGVGFQLDAKSPEWAEQCFRYSCECCSSKGLKLECDRCAIRVIHIQTIAAFEGEGFAIKQIAG